jgi:hypothetical protein
MSMSKVSEAGTTEVQKVVPNEVFNTRGVVKKLEDLMTDVTKETVTPDTVNAACNCAGRITEILRIHLEVERLKIRRAGQ